MPEANIVAMIMLHPPEALPTYGTHAKNELMLMAIIDTTRAAFDFFAAGTTSAINMAYNAMPMEFCSMGGSTEEVKAPTIVPKAHPQ